jgi:hypothetical protein
MFVREMTATEIRDQGHVFVNEALNDEVTLRRKYDLHQKQEDLIHKTIL